MPASLTPETLKKIIGEGLEKNGRMTTDCLEAALSQWSLAGKDISYIVQLVNESFNKNKNRGNRDAIVDDNTIKQILSVIKLSNQLKGSFSTIKRMSYPNRDNRCAHEMADTVKSRNALGFVMKRGASSI